MFAIFKLFLFMNVLLFKQKILNTKLSVRMVFPWPQNGNYLKLHFAALFCTKIAVSFIVSRVLASFTVKTPFLLISVVPFQTET